MFSALALATPAVFGQVLTTSMPPQMVRLGNVEMKPNQVCEFAAPLSAKARYEVAKNGRSVQSAKGALAVPDGFDPKQIWPVLVISTSSGGSAIAAMRAFTNVALSEGWVVLAADSPIRSADVDHQDWNWAMLSSVLDYLHRTWTESKRWPFACAGFSGGAKRSIYVAASLVKEHRVIGTFLGGCNEDRSWDAIRLYRPGEAFKTVPVFLSCGTSDQIASPEQQTAVKQSLERGGFKNVRLVTYDGGHSLDNAHVRLALKWFAPAYKRKAPVPTPEPALK